ncbi:uncharacterized protein O3C94_016500 [Discoglossus pictus]
MVCGPVALVQHLQKMLPPSIWGVELEQCQLEDACQCEDPIEGSCLPSELEVGVTAYTTLSPMVSGYEDENLYPKLMNEDAEYEKDEAFIHQMEGLHDECVDTLLAVKEEEDEKDIVQVSIHSDICAGHARSSIISQFDQEAETDLRSHQQVKEEENLVNISDVACLCHGKSSQTARQSTHAVATTRMPSLQSSAALMDF